MRRLLTLEGRDTGRQVPTDVFIMARGEPANRAVTKIGGLPFWPTDTPWPHDPYGCPLIFMAQINLTDSTDITGPLPGDLLLLFATADCDEIKIIWSSCNGQSLLVDSVPKTDWTIDPCYGVLYRTVDYPDITDDIFAAYAQPYLLACLEGTKIGGVPRWIQDEEQLPGRFLCALSSVQPAFEQPYPFVNIPEPITTFTELYGTNDLMIDDMGSYYLFIDNAGQVHITEQCY